MPWDFRPYWFICTDLLTGFLKIDYDSVNTFPSGWKI